MKSVDCLKDLLLSVLNFTNDIVADEYFLFEDLLLFDLGDLSGLGLLSLLYHFIFALNDLI